MNNAYPKWLEHKNLCKQIQWRKEYEIPVKEIGQLLLVKKKKTTVWSILQKKDNGKWHKALSLSSLFALILVGCERIHTAVHEE